MLNSIQGIGNNTMKEIYIVKNRKAEKEMATIIEQAIKGNRSALKKLYTSNKQKAFYTALLLTENSKEASEAVKCGFKNALSSMFTHSSVTEKNFTYLFVSRTADYCKRKVFKNDSKAFHIPQGRNFLISGNGKIQADSDDIALCVIKELPILQRYILILHGIGEYSPKQLVGAFKFDTKTVSIALEAEQKNVQRILRRLDQEDLSYEDIIGKLQGGEKDVTVSSSVDEYAEKLIDSIADPIEKKAKTRTFTVCACILAAFILIGSIVLIANRAGSGSSTNDTSSDVAESDNLISEPVIDLDENLTYYADIEIDGYGTVTVELDQIYAPITTANFINLANNGFYDGLTFHRIMEEYMIQGGCPTGDGYGGNTDENGNDINIVGEFINNDYYNPLSHTRGAISMARTSEYNSASSQFFIVLSDYYVETLDEDYAVFGYVTEGMEVLDSICEDAGPTDENGIIEDDYQTIVTSITIRTVDSGTDTVSDDVSN